VKRIGYIVPGGREQTAEELAGWSFLRRSAPGNTLRVRPGRGLSELNPRHTPVVWWHTDADVSPLVEHDDTLPSLRRYIEGGGTLLLSLIASRAVVDLGIEQNVPTVVPRSAWGRTCWAEGYPDIRGFSSFLGHPLFSGLGGAVYTWNPLPESLWCGVYYEAPAAPRDGRVVAVERQYIKLQEDWRLVTEYTVGKGLVLAVGTYLFFDDRRVRFARHRNQFTENCLEYLSRGGRSGSRKTFWNFDVLSVSPSVRQSSRLRPSLADPELPHTDLSISRREAADVPFDTGGRRVLVAGNERRGISEVWCHPLRASREVSASLISGKEVIPLHTLRPSVTHRPESFTRLFTWEETSVEETVFGDLEVPAAVIRYRVRSPRRTRLVISARIDLRIMWPLSEKATGPLSFAWDAGLQAGAVSSASGMHALVGSSVMPVRHLIGQFSRVECGADGITATPGDRQEVMVAFEIALRAGSDACTVVIAGSASHRYEAERAYRACMASPRRVLARQVRHWKGTFRNRTMVTSPDTMFNQAYRWALVATDRFYARTPGVGEAYMAGFGTTEFGWDGGQAVSGRPGYAWYFGRDSVWMSMATLASGDRHSVRGMLEFLGDHQGLDGKILHEITTSGHCHYDAADSTPLYIILLGRYLRATGDRSFARAQFARLARAVEFCRRTDTDRDHLIENTNVGHGWVEGGSLFPVHSELYLVACWAEALRQAAAVARTTGHARDAALWERESGRVREIIERDFWNTRTAWYNFAKRADGTYVEEQTVLPAVGTLFGLTRPERARAMLREIASSNFSADWGTRIVGRDTPRYNPKGYHYGSVWPLFTGWAALAEFRAGRPLQGFIHLMRNAALHRLWSLGCTPEVVHGERCEPAGVCTHQGWSSSMVLQPALEGMLGLETDAGRNTVSLRPYVPPHWKRMDIRNIRCGKATIHVSIRQHPGRISYHVTGTQGTHLCIGPLLPSGAVITGIHIGSTSLRRPLPTPAPEVRFTLRGRTTLTVVHRGGVALLPPAPTIEPGTTSRGLRILEETSDGTAYALEVEAPGAHSAALSIADPDNVLAETTDAAISSRERGVLSVTLGLPGEAASGTYVRRTIRFARRQTTDPATSSPGRGSARSGSGSP